MRDDVLDGARPGPVLLEGRRCRFSVWAPRGSRAELEVVHPYEKTLPMRTEAGGSFVIEAENVEPGVRYRFRVDGGSPFPDPAARRQPEGPGGPSEVVSPDHAWSDGYWCGLPLHDLVLYEMSVPAFSREGTLAAAAARLRSLKELGFTGLVLMPVAERSPASRDWGYGSAFPFSVAARLGTPEDLKRLVDAAHKEGLAVVLDLPFGAPADVPDTGEPQVPDLRLLEVREAAEGLAPYLAGGRWNLDGADSDECRRFLLASASMWLEEFHVDALRVRHADGLADRSPFPFLEELGEAVHACGRRSNRLAYLFAHSPRNDARLVRQRELGGLGLDALALEDFQHALWSLLSGERLGYYQDFGGLEPLAKAFAEGFVFTGQRSDHHRRRHGGPSAAIPPRRLVAFARDHESTAASGRGASRLSFESLKLAAGAVLLSPYLPMVFMGEEYGETAPFERLSDEASIERCRLDPALRERPKPTVLAGLVSELCRLRKTHPAFQDLRDRPRAEALPGQDVLLLLRGPLFAAFHFGDLPLDARLKVAPGNWTRLLDSSDERWGGAGSSSPAFVGASEHAAMTLQPKSFVLYEKTT